MCYTKDTNKRKGEKKMEKIKVYAEVSKTKVELLAEINTTLTSEVNLEKICEAFKYTTRYNIFVVVDKKRYKPLKIKSCKTIDEYHSRSELNQYKIVEVWF